MSNQARTKEAIQLLHSTAVRYKQPLSENEVVLWLEDLRDLCRDYSVSLDDIKEAFKLHMRDPKHGSFMPKLADICRHLPQRISAYPSANEAWAIALPAQNEANTVVWTQMIADAFFCCKPIIDGGDKVGARMAFIAAYERLVAEDQRNPNKQTNTWYPCLGHDAEMRDVVVNQAIERGLLPNNESKLPQLAYTAVAEPEIRNQLFAQIEKLGQKITIAKDDNLEFKEIKKCPKQPPMPNDFLPFKG